MEYDAMHLCLLHWVYGGLHTSCGVPTPVMYVTLRVPTTAPRVHAACSVQRAAWSYTDLMHRTAPHDIASRSSNQDIRYQHRGIRSTGRMVVYMKCPRVPRAVGRTRGYIETD